MKPSGQLTLSFLCTLPGLFLFEITRARLQIDLLKKQAEEDFDFFASFNQFFVEMEKTFHKVFIN